MRELLHKLNYKGYKRIALINSEEQFSEAISKELENVVIDSEIDQRCPYDYMMFFVKEAADVENYSQIALHNLTADGILWFCYPKKSSKKNTSDLERDKGWESLNDLGFYGIRMISIDEYWSAMRFRNAKYIKSTSGRYPIR